MIFWREEWLRKVEEKTVQSQVGMRDIDRLRTCLKVSTGPGVYYCQASELSKASACPLAVGKIKKIFERTPCG